MKANTLIRKDAKTINNHFKFEEVFDFYKHHADGETKLNWYLATANKRHGAYDLHAGREYLIAKIENNKQIAYLVVENHPEGDQSQEFTKIIPEFIAKEYLKTVRTVKGKLIKAHDELADILNNNYAGYDDKISEYRKSFWERWRMEEMSI